jgi:hypothetical protein
MERCIKDKKRQQKIYGLLERGVKLVESGGVESSAMWRDK